MLIEHDIILDKSYMFHNYRNLLDFIMPENIKEDKEDLDKSNKYESFYSKYQIMDKAGINKLNNTNDLFDLSQLDNYSFPLNSMNNQIKFYDDNYSELSDYSIISQKTKNLRINNKNTIKSYYDMCSSLIYLPDITRWNTEYTINISNMFNGCSNLISLPDISKWNT